MQLPVAGCGSRRHSGTVTDRAHGSLLYIFGSYLVRYSTYMPRRKYGLYATAAVLNNPFIDVTL